MLLWGNINPSSLTSFRNTWIAQTQYLHMCVCPQNDAEEAAAFLYLSYPIIKHILPFISLLLPLLWPYNLPQFPFLQQTFGNWEELIPPATTPLLDLSKHYSGFKGEESLNTPVPNLAGLFSEIWGKNPQITDTKFWAAAHDVIQTAFTHLHILIWTTVENYLKTTIFSRRSSKIKNFTEVWGWVWGKQIHPTLAIHRQISKLAFWGIRIFQV